MKEQIRAHFETKDQTVAHIVSLADSYDLPGTPMGSVFEAFARSIANQQISGAVARTILGRLTARFGGRFPTPAELAATPTEELRAVGFSGSKVAALHDLAAHYVDGRLPPDAELATLDDEALIERCVAVRGIGRWTVQMVLMFQLGRHDVMPSDDFGVRNGFRLAYGLKGMPRPRALLKYAERWKPFRSAGAWYMWRAVELHQQGVLPKREGRPPRIECEAPREKPARSKPAAKKAGRSPVRKPGAAKRPGKKRPGKKRAARKR